MGLLCLLCCSLPLTFPFITWVITVVSSPVPLPPAFPFRLSSLQTLENLLAVDSCHRISRTVAFISSIVCRKQSNSRYCVVRVLFVRSQFSSLLSHFFHPHCAQMGRSLFYICASNIAHIFSASAPSVDCPHTSCSPSVPILKLSGSL